MKDKKEVEIQWVDLFDNPIKKETYDLRTKEERNKQWKIIKKQKQKKEMIAYKSL